MLHIGFARALLLCVCAQPSARDAHRDDDRLAMTPAIACLAIRGYEDYDVRDEPAIENEEKLLLYFKTKNQTIQRAGSKYKVHLVEDVKVRRKGEKAILWSRDKIVSYQVSSEQRPENLYIATTLAFKGIPAGEYEAELILHDRLTKEATASQVFQFRIKPAAASTPPAKPGKPRNKTRADSPAEERPKRD